MALTKSWVYLINAFAFVLVGVFVVIAAGPTADFYGIETGVMVISQAMLAFLLALIILNLVWLYGQISEAEKIR